MDPTPSSRLVINASCAIDPAEIEWRFGPSGGPGGQHANRSNTRAEARFDIAGSPSLTEPQRKRLLERIGSTITVVADDTRSQARNRTAALERLRERLAAALVVERPRRATRPSKAAVARRLDDKRRVSERKSQRRAPRSGDD